MPRVIKFKEILCTGTEKRGIRQICIQLLHSSSTSSLLIYNGKAVVSEATRAYEQSAFLADYDESCFAHGKKKHWVWCESVIKDHFSTALKVSTFVMFLAQWFGNVNSWYISNGASFSYPFCMLQTDCPLKKGLRTDQFVTIHAIHTKHCKATYMRSERSFAKKRPLNKVMSTRRNFEVMQLFFSNVVVLSYCGRFEMEQFFPSLATK